VGGEFSVDSGLDGDGIALWDGQEWIRVRHGFERNISRFSGIGNSVFVGTDSPYSMNVYSSYMTRLDVDNFVIVRGLLQGPVALTGQDDSLKIVWNGSAWSSNE
jgi:hypothetical protein